MHTSACQMECTDTMHVSRPKPVALPNHMRMVILISQRIPPRVKRFIKRALKRLRGQPASKQPDGAAASRRVTPPAVALKAGDMVRVRSLEEIKATLNDIRRLKGCQFMPEMEPYCGTIQRVYKPVERFLNEGDYTVRKASGIVLLENLFCQGVAVAGRCDRSCFYFWRVEWLEPLEPGGEGSPGG